MTSAASVSPARVLDLVDDAVVARDLDGTVVTWNAAAERLYGWSRAEAVGRRCHALLETRFPGSADEAHRHLLERGRWEGELGQTRKDGSSLLVSARWAVDRDGAGSVLVVERCTDVTASRAAETALRESEERYRAVFAATPVGMAIVDLDGAVVGANPALGRLLGRAPEELPSLRLVDLSHPQDRDVEAELQRQLAAGRRGEYRLEKRYVRADGSTAPARVTVSLIADPLGRPRFAVAIVEDLSLTLLDETTGLSNRRAFVFFGQQQAKLAHRERRALTLVYVDIERLGTINEVHGRAEGDRAIADTAAILVETFRSSDFISRVGGGAFAVLLSAPGSEASPAGARLLAAVEEWNRRRGRVYELSLAVARAVSTPHAPKSIEEMLDDAARTLERQRLA